ncbi:MAG: PTS sugar transporter subunit IIA, partial [Planctomycetota bacterium]
LAACIAEAPGIREPQAFHQAIMEREAIGSTGIGRGVAIPHCKLPSIEGFIIGIGIAATGIDYGSPDNKPVRLLVMIGATDQERRDYLRLLATVAGLLKDPAILDALIACRDPERVVELFHRS